MSDAKETWREAHRQRAAGNYVLDSDIPWLQERLANRDREVIDKIMAERGPVYEELLSEYGMTQSEKIQTLHHIAMIYQAKLDARKAMTAQMNAQQDFDNQMKKILGDRYKDYLAYESLSRAREESNLIQQFAETSNLTPISAERADALNSLIRDTNSYTLNITGSLAGPRDQIERPRYGEAVLPMLEENQAMLSLGSAAAIQLARERGFTPQEIGTIQAYYDKEIEKYDLRIQRASNSLDGQIAALERMLTNLRSRNASPSVIAPYEEAITRAYEAKQKGGSR